MIASPRRVALAAAASVLTLPATASATDMSGLAVVVFGLFLGVPALILLVVLVAVTLAFSSAPHRPWHPTYAMAVSVVAPLVGLAFPLSILFMGGSHVMDATLLALVFDLPALVLAVVVVVFAGRLLRRAKSG